MERNSSIKLIEISYLTRKNSLNIYRIPLIIKFGYSCGKIFTDTVII